VAYSEVAAPASLADSVECLWALELKRDDPPTDLRFLPDGMTEIVVGGPAGSDPRHRRAFVVGPLTRSQPFPWGGPFSATGLRLRPGAARRVFGLPASALRDRTVALDALGVGLPPREDPDARRADLIGLVEARKGRPDRAFMDLLGEVAAGGARIGPARLDRGVAERTLRRTFEREVGYGPATFLRVTRFRRLLAAAADAQPRTWAERAAAAGYYDQAHMNREVRALAGVAPTSLLAPCLSVLT